MPYPLYIVDAFTSRRYAGNPAAVCLLPGPMDSEWMQSVAAELNLSETAFVYGKDDLFHLKWFTPVAEVELCGHATLAAAHILWETNRLTRAAPATFETLSGKLTAVRAAAWITLDFPALAVEETAPKASLIEALGVRPIFTGRSRFDALIEVATEDEVRRAAPDQQALARETSIRGTILTARSSSIEYDFVSRFFAPAVGINEDPVTGSAHCCLAPHWASKLGRTDLTARQLSKRGGALKTTVRGPRVELSGQAITTVSGQLL